ncbi:MAG: tetratricopeptide repeat protein [Pseudomonadota bacterium]
MPPLQLDSQELSAEDALAVVSTPELLALTDEMRSFVDRYVYGDARQRLHLLHRGLISPALVGIEYSPDADGSAAEAFHSGAANCLSYAHLFIALARYAGLDARYLSVSLRPEWSRHGSKIALRKHVNVAVTLRNGDRYVVDIDPVSRDRIAHSDVLTDKQAFALYHGNVAMGALLAGDDETAFTQALRAIQLAPDIDYLWINLGAIYRQRQQDNVAETLYHTALQLNPNSRTAMNNLAVLHESRGDSAQAAQWAARVQQRRNRNPFYHYYLGEVAESEGDYLAALEHFGRAIELHESEAEFYYRMARIYLTLNQRDRSRDYAEEAVARATLVRERQSYKAFLQSLSDDRIAAALEGV